MRWTMKKNAHGQNNRRPGEASLGRKAFSVVMSGLLVWSLSARERDRGNC